MPMLPAVESFIEDGKLCLCFDLPGLDPKDIDISIAGDTVAVRASRERRSNEAMGTSNAPRSATAGSSGRSR
jgi:HSP20 family molecular chaperone IbpA